MPKPKGSEGSAVSARELAEENRELWLFIGRLCAERAAAGMEARAAGEAAQTGARAFGRTPGEAGL